MSRFYKALPLVNFTIASAALYIQSQLLLPWHDELDNSFRSLREHRDRENQVMLSRLHHMERRVMTMDQTFAELKDQRNRENRDVLALLADIRRRTSSE